MRDFPSTFPRSRMEFSNTAKARGIKNTCPDDLLPGLIDLAWTLDSIEKALKVRYGEKAKLDINCAYRCEQLNAAVGGSPTSAHKKGRAADITCNACSPYDLAVFIFKMGINHDQIIQEFGRWVHVGMAEHPRKQALTARKINGKTVYLQGLMPV
ncbi:MULTISPECIES: D-Ala-D-Ala carboxypeptidase family metallohydrolase [Chromobacterium]|uniref:D-Ala-D-Ala carboxypeptidase family metallohydrolase n=1 Tax=Chromobacterium phragmitis TaxID=2202141 RepID=A0ABV0J0G9_9NEIS|nr:D-Ala-D-Ala carboxypeptidase family metallohydrolase [Chromobacterium sp. ASV23]